MDARAINAALRRGETPSDADLRWFAQGLADGTVSDAQAGAFAMAVCLQGLSTDGRRALTLAMRDSGDVLSWDLRSCRTDIYTESFLHENDKVNQTFPPLFCNL